MRATQFIKEAVVTPYEHEELDIKAAVDTLNKYCSQSVSMIANPLWRGMTNHKENIFTLWPETGQRKSENTSNHYTEIMSNSPYMRGWPRRDKSIICSSGVSYAEGYTGYGSEVYAIFPYDNVEIAVCPTEDLWDIRVSVPGFTKKVDMDDLNKTLLRYRIDGTYEEMTQQLNNPSSIQYIDVKQELKIDPPTLLPSIQKVLSPEHAGFKLMSVNEFASAPPINKECWVSGPCVAMKESVWKRFKQAVVNRNIKNAGK